MNKQTILIVEDEKHVLEMLESALKKNGYRTITVDTGRKALSVIASHCPDLVLLDLGLPDIDGQKIIKSVRAWSPMPILVLSGKTKEKDVVNVLDLGADDYIKKPFGMNELLARIRVVFRRNSQLEYYKMYTPVNTYRVGDFEIDFKKRMVTIRGVPVHLTQIEYKIVNLLARNAGCVLSYEKIIQTIWGPYAAKNNKILRVNMSNIRHKIEKNPTHPEVIVTVAGIGYRMIEIE